MPPFTQRFTGAFNVGHAAQEGRNGKPFVRKRESDVVPEFTQGLGRFRPQRHGVQALDRPFRMQTHHVLVKDLASQTHALVALLHLAQIIFFIRRQRPLELRGEQVLKVLFLHRHHRQCATGLAALQGHQRGAQGQILQFLIVIHVGFAVPAMLAAQPAHLRRSVIQPHLGHHFIFQQFQSPHGIIVRKAFRLLTGACVERSEQNGKVGDEAGHARN